MEVERTRQRPFLIKGPRPMDGQKSEGGPKTVFLVRLQGDEGWFRAAAEIFQDLEERDLALAQGQMLIGLSMVIMEMELPH